MADARHVHDRMAAEAEARRSGGRPSRPRCARTERLDAIGVTQLSERVGRDDAEHERLSALPAEMEERRAEPVEKIHHGSKTQIR